MRGTLDRLTARLLAELAGKQLDRAPHVVIDLGEVSVLDPRELTILLTLHQQAMARGTELHIVGAEHDAIRLPLQVTGLAQLLSLESTADAVIAGLPRPGHVSHRHFPAFGPHQQDADPAFDLGEDYGRGSGPTSSTDRGPVGRRPARRGEAGKQPGPPKPVAGRVK